MERQALDAFAASTARDLVAAGFRQDDLELSNKPMSLGWRLCTRSVEIFDVFETVQRMGPPTNRLWTKMEYWLSPDGVLTTVLVVDEEIRDGMKRRSVRYVSDDRTPQVASDGDLDSLGFIWVSGTASNEGCTTREPYGPRFPIQPAAARFDAVMSEINTLRQRAGLPPLRVR